MGNRKKRESKRERREGVGRAERRVGRVKIEGAKRERERESDSMK